MFSSSVLLSVFGTLIIVMLAVAGALGTFAAMRVGKHAQVIKNFEDAAKSWREKAEAQESDIGQLKAENAQLDQEVSELRGQVSVLREIVRSALEQLVTSSGNSDVVARIETLLARGRDESKRGDSQHEDS